MRSARIRLASLWLSQTTRGLADNCLRMFVILKVAEAGKLQSEAAWYQVTPFFILPFILLAPVNGALSNGLPKRWVLVGSAGYCLAVAVLLGLFLGASADGWLWCLGLGLVMIGTAVYSPTRYALLPAVASDTHLSLARVTGWIEMGGAAAVVLGLVLGVYLHDTAWPGGWPLPIPVAVAGTIALDVIALLAALPAWFHADVRRPEPPGKAIGGFFRDIGRIVADTEARGSLLGLVGFLALMLIGSGAVLAYSRGLHVLDKRETLSQAMIFLGVGAAVGSLLAGLQNHPRRSLGLVPAGATGLLIALAWATVSADVAWPCLVLGIMGGLVNVPLRATYQGAVPADARGNGMAVLNTAYYLSAAVLAGVLFGLVRLKVLTPAGQLWVLAALAGVGALAACWYLFRDSVELLLEILIWPIYRIHGYGPGLERVPLRGPVLVVANHAAYVDPFLVAKVIPRRLFPLMTSMFYDLPIMHWLMVHLVHAIRVPAVNYRREAPELQDAIALLDKGESVLIFPEGSLRRRDNVALRRFGQGVWHILSQRPQTPVVVCWVEGAWGCFFSYRGGRPMKNKRFDFWRHIDIAVGEPQVLDPAVLKDLRETRIYLMRVCLETHRHLGLEVPTNVDLSDDDSEETAADEEKAV